MHDDREITPQDAWYNIKLNAMLAGVLSPVIAITAIATTYKEWAWWGLAAAVAMGVYIANVFYKTHDMEAPVPDDAKSLNIQIRAIWWWVGCVVWMIAAGIYSKHGQQMSWELLLYWLPVQYLWYDAYCLLVRVGVGVAKKPATGSKALPSEQQGETLDLNEVQKQKVASGEWKDRDLV